MSDSRPRPGDVRGCRPRRARPSCGRGPCAPRLAAAARTSARSAGVSERRPAGGSLRSSGAAGRPGAYGPDRGRSCRVAAARLPVFPASITLVVDVAPARALRRPGDLGRPARRRRRRARPRGGPAALPDRWAPSRTSGAARESTITRAATAPGPVASAPRRSRGRSGRRSGPAAER